ncbi:uncharacterized protein LOC119112839 [Pollicipes pollicipes]|uniref:uncharacterized protein LOC119112839 n=1 Tax=Pollicipes pollicipes TaxID=41117 RepID=UPI0018854C48|nr:uncharacterized protein LOC119112839 [Pollicipes pollicipes]
MTNLTFPSADGQPTSFLSDRYLANASLQLENEWREGSKRRWVPVGNSSRHLGLQLQLGRLVAYSEQGGAVPASSLQSRCTGCDAGTDQPTIMEVALNRSSYQLAILAPVHEQGADMFSCGPLTAGSSFLSVAAAAWTVVASRLPVGARVLDTCGRPERARDQLFGLLSSAAADPRRLVGVISLSEATGAGVADMLQQAGVPHVCVPVDGHGAVYDRLAGPYRTVPLVEHEVHAIVSLARRFGWGYLSVLHSTDAYGVRALQQLTETAPQHDICVGSVIGVGGGFGAAEATGAYAELRRPPAAPTVVILVSRPEQTRLLLAAAARGGVDDRLLFVVGRHWGPQLADETLAPVLRRAVFVTLPEAPVTPVTRWLAAMTPSDHEPFPDAWFAEYSRRERGCQPAGVADGAERPACVGDRNDTAPPVSPYVYHAALAVSVLLDSLDGYLRRHCVPGEPCARLVGAELMAEMDTRLANASGPQRARLMEADGLRVWTLPDGRRPRSLGSYRRGLLRLAGPIGLLTRHRSGCSSGPCLQTCARQSDKFASLSVPMPLPDLEGFRSIFGVICVAFSALGVLVALICLIYFNASASRICRSPVDCQVLIGLMLVCCDNAAFLLQPSAAVCGTRRFLTGFAYATVYSALLVKVIHLWRVRGGRSDELSQRGALLLVALCLLVIQALLAAAWLVLSPPRVELLDAAYRCSPAGRFEQDLAVSLSYVLVLKLMLACFCMAGWRSAESHHEPRWLLATVVVNSAIWTGWLGVALSWPQTNRDNATVLCNLACTCVFFVCLYLRKVLLFNYLWRNPDDPELHSPMTVSTINNSFLMQMPAKLKNFSFVRTPQLSERIQENARTWNPSTEENSASLSFADDESMDLDRSLSVHEFPLAEEHSRTAAACLHVEAVTSSSESEDMDHYDTPKALNEFVRRMGDRTVLVLPSDHAGQDEDSKI